MERINIAVAGASGRMGQKLIQAVLEDESAVLSGALVRENSKLVDDVIVDEDNNSHQMQASQMQVSQMQVRYSSDVESIIAKSDVLIEFTLPEYSVQLAEHFAQYAKEIGKSRKLAIISGTTGYSTEQQNRIDEISQHIAFFNAPNMSFGVNLLLDLVQKAAAILDEESYDAEILEMHHRMKLDAPSGTALALGEAVAAGRGHNLDAIANYERHNQHRDELAERTARKAGELGFATMRGGGVVGEHEVLFVSDDEKITLSHQAFDRMVFARGAVRAAKWLAGKEPGRYNMCDILANSK